MKVSSLLTLIPLAFAIFSSPPMTLGGESDSAISPNSILRMNGYAMGDFGDFIKNWRLVTVRFRKDTNEMRFTYANESAWKIISENRIDYPDGAVFAKVAVASQADPDFESSAVPSGARRVQFMVKNAQKHPTTDGWGYALFDGQGHTFPGDPKINSMACATCHRLVPQRGYVFSQPMGLQSLFGESALAKEAFISLKFVDRDVLSLPAELRDLIALKSPGLRSIRVISGDLSKFVFSGALDEIRPALSRETLRAKIPSALVSDDGALFSIVFFGEKSKKCAESKNEMAMQGFHTLPASVKGKLYEVLFCQAPTNP